MARGPDIGLRQGRKLCQMQHEDRLAFIASGIDGDHEDLFKPFVRRSSISSERRELGMGGTGLGLTIVEMIAESRGCDVDFVDTDDTKWSTTFEMSWRVEK